MTVPSNVAPAPTKRDVDTNPDGPDIEEKPVDADFTPSELRMFPVQPTVEDALGIERIVGPALDNWEPPQVDPTEEEIAQLERARARSKEAQEVRKAAFTSKHPAAIAYGQEHGKAAEDDK